MAKSRKQWGRNQEIRQRLQPSYLFPRTQVFVSLGPSKEPRSSSSSSTSCRRNSSSSSDSSSSRCPSNISSSSSRSSSSAPDSCAFCSCRRERSKVPYIVRQCLEEIERRGLEEVGIYRVSGVATDIQALKTAFDSSQSNTSTRLPLCSDKSDH